MARRLTGLSRGFARSNRRKTAWELGPGGTTVTAITSTSSVILGAGASPTEDGLTVVRTRGEFLAFLESATAEGGFSGAFGIGKGSASAFAVGVGSMETPLDDEEWDGWLFHRYFTVKNPTVGTATATDQPNSSAGSGILRLEVDSKAMRKLDIEDVIYAAVQVVVTGTAQVLINFNSRLLVKLP